MKLLADENLDLSVVERLREAGHQVFAVAEMEPGISDDVVLDRANRETAILITEDKDFGELAFRQSLVHYGVILVGLQVCRLLQKRHSSTCLRCIDSNCPARSPLVSPGLVRIRSVPVPEPVHRPQARHSSPSIQGYIPTPLLQRSHEIGRPRSDARSKSNSYSALWSLGRQSLISRRRPNRPSTSKLSSLSNHPGRRSRKGFPTTYRISPGSTNPGNQKSHAISARCGSEERRHACEEPMGYAGTLLSHLSRLLALCSRLASPCSLHGACGMRGNRL